MEEAMVSKALDNVLDLIQRHTLDALKQRTLDPLRRVTAPIRHLDKAERKTARAYLKATIRNLTAYLEDPHPYGEARLELAASNAYVANGILTGQGLSRLSEIPSHVRDTLQYCKSAGGVLTEPHVVSRDRSVPLFLEPPRLMRQFRCEAWAAFDLQQCFMALDADSKLVAEYATRAKDSGLDAILLELNHLASQLTQIEHTYTDFYSAHCVCEHDPDQHRASGRCSALACTCKRYVEAQQLPYHDGDPEPDDDAQWLGHYEPIAYHKIASDTDPQRPATIHPWITRFAEATREELPRLRQLAFAAMQQDKWPSHIAGAVWNDANIQLIRKASPAYRHMLNQIEHATTPAELARLGTTAYQRQTTWTTSERAYFWRAYQTRKVTLTGADSGTQPSVVREVGVVGELPTGELVLQYSDGSLRAVKCEADSFYTAISETFHEPLRHLTLTSRRPLSQEEAATLTRRIP
jgi:hypothetical protein